MAGYHTLKWFASLPWKVESPHSQVPSLFPQIQSEEKLSSINPRTKQWREDPLKGRDAVEAENTLLPWEPALWSRSHGT